MSDLDEHGTAPAGAVPDPAALTDALRQLSTLLLLTAEAADSIVSALTGQPVSTAADMYPDSQPDTSAGSARPKLAVVRTIPAPRGQSPHDADSVPHYVRDVEALPNGRHRARVRWPAPERGTHRYHSRSKTFDTPAAAWRWADRWAADHADTARADER